VKTEPLVSKLVQDINIACRFIEDQLFLTHNIKLHHANFYFKLDQEGELNLLFATHLFAEPIIWISSYKKDFSFKIPEEQYKSLIDHSTADQKFNDSDFMYTAGDNGICKGECSICTRIIKLDESYAY